MNRLLPRVEFSRDCGEDARAVIAAFEPGTLLRVQSPPPRYVKRSGKQAHFVAVCCFADDPGS